MRTWFRISTESALWHLLAHPDSAEWVGECEAFPYLRSGAKVVGTRQDADGGWRVILDVPSEPTGMLL